MDNPYHPIQVAGGALRSQKINLEVPSWSLRDAEHPPQWLEKMSLIRIEKSPFSWLRKIKARLTLLQQATENSKEGKSKQRTKDQETETKKEQKKYKTLNPYEQQCQLHTCSGTKWKRHPCTILLRNVGLKENYNILLSITSRQSQQKPCIRN